MTDRTCPKCNYLFKFPNLLKKHFRNSFHCLLNEEEIKLFFNPNRKNIIKCNTCGITFKQKSSLYRHQRNIKCSNLKIQTQPQPQIPPSHLTQIQNQTNNTHNTTIINNNNNIINIQHINPFGFEDVRTIPISEMKTILSSGDDTAGIQIIKAIYNKIENKNFYKPNLSRPEIACLNIDFNLTIYKSKEFCDALFDRCIVFLHHMLYLCKNEYSNSKIKNIYDNIEYIETSMRTEIYDKQLQNIIESEFRNNNLDNKDRIKKFIKETKDYSEIKAKNKAYIDNLSTLKTDSDNEYKSSMRDEINKALGEPQSILALNKKELINEFNIKHFDETQFYKFWKDRIKKETSYINKSKTTKIGDIKYIKYRKTEIELMLNIIKARSDNLRGGEKINLDVDDFIINDMDYDTEDEEENEENEENHKNDKNDKNEENDESIESVNDNILISNVVC